MSLDNVINQTLRTGMLKSQVNELVGEWVTLNDEIYLGSKYKHEWECSCGNIFTRSFLKIKFTNRVKCGTCVKLKRYDELEGRYLKRMRLKPEYEYYGLVPTNHKLTNGEVANEPFIKVRHKYCGKIYETRANQFFEVVESCPHCCQVYEKSFAYHIEVELGLDINDIWDFEKNTVSPYYINKKTDKVKIWIKCQEKDYHGSYETTCVTYHSGYRCGYCKPHHHSNTVHPYDSFGYHNLDKVMSWHPDNEISPFRVSLKSSRKFKFICEECGSIFTKRLYEIANLNSWCKECGASEGEKRVVRCLRKYNKIYEYQKTYKGLQGVGGGELSYDFYLPEDNILIEFQGDQHKEFTPIFHKRYSDFEKQQEHDRRKREYAKNNGIGLVEIWEEDNVNDIIGKIGQCYIKYNTGGNYFD